MPLLTRFALAVVVLVAASLARSSTSTVSGNTGQAWNPRIDFTCVGYRAGEPIPVVRPVLRVVPTGSDDTVLLQGALDQIGRMEPDATGFRGALHLGPGTYRVSGSLEFKAAGVVLRGSGHGVNGTRLVATGVSRRSLLVVNGAVPALEAPAQVIDALVPVGASSFQVPGLALRPGTRVRIERPSTAEWIHELGMDAYDAPGSFDELRVRWLPGSRNLAWYRTVVSYDAATGGLVLDAPLTSAIEARWSGALVSVATGGFLERRGIGIENVELVSEFSPSRPHDEEHAWIGVQFEGGEDLWCSRVVFRHFAGSAVRVGPGARRVTIQNCESLAPVSEPGGYRRHTFLVEGQQVLVRGCNSEQGVNDFAVGQLCAGPVAFVDCVARNAVGDSGAFESWASGALYENVQVEGAGIRLDLDWTRSQGAGWTAANSVLLNCSASRLAAAGHPSAPNLVVANGEPLLSVRHAGEHALHFTVPPGDCPVFRSPAAEPAREAPKHPELRVVNGRFALGEQVVWGSFVDEGWWRGQTYPAIAVKLGSRNITRFVPGRVGPGLTEDLPEMANDYANAGHRFFYGGVGLWYDRRRDDHLCDPRDAQVWAPFFEMPWARTGQGRAWDGLSKYDVSQYNPWFFERTKAFARECERVGIIHCHYLYSTHNILETQAHWVDFPWRPANCVNDVGIPEPPPLDPKNTVHLANVFYDVSHPGRRKLHRAYIFKTLDELAGHKTVVFDLAAQFAGPLAFQQFFLDTVAEWERAHGQRVRLMIQSSKDITEAILADPVRSRQISVVNLRYWMELPDGGTWAPRGDQNLAFREMTTQQFGTLSDSPPPTTAALLYKQVREYRERYPDKALVTWFGGVDSVPAFMAGAAQVIVRYRPLGHTQASIPDMSVFDRFVREELSGHLAELDPVDGFAGGEADVWTLSDAKRERVLIYSTAGPSIRLKGQRLPAEVSGVWFQPRDGRRVPITSGSLKAGQALQKPDGGPWMLWLQAGSWAKAAARTGGP